jgi:hypothetical protein
MRRKMFVNLYVVLSLLLFRTKERTYNLNQNGLSPERDMNPGLPEYQTGEPPTGLRYSIGHHIQVRAFRSRMECGTLLFKVNFTEQNE